MSYCHWFRFDWFNYKTFLFLFSNNFIRKTVEFVKQYFLRKLIFFSRNWYFCLTIILNQNKLSIKQYIWPSLIISVAYQYCINTRYKRIQHQYGTFLWINLIFYSVRLWLVKYASLWPSWMQYKHKAALTLFSILKT